MSLNTLNPVANSRNVNFKTLIAFRTILRCFACKNESSKTKPVILEPDCKTAVVVGGLGDIGFATAQQLLCEKAKKVAITGIDAHCGLEAVNRLNCTFGRGKSIFFKCDIKDKREVEDTMSKIKSEMGLVDIIVNTTGIWDDAYWQEALQVNLGGTINVTLAAETCIKKGNGVIVNVTGFQGLKPFPPSPLFAAFASGVINFSRSFGHDINYKKLGIRVVVLCVGITQTNFLVDVHKRMLTKDMGDDLTEYIKKACSQKPEACAKSIVEIVKYGPSGSVWFVEGSRLFFYDVPDYSKNLNLVSQFI